MSSPDGRTSSEETREAIMEATFRALSKHGYADLRMRDIGEEFEMTRPVIHYHYNSKHELISSFLEYVIAQYKDDDTIDAEDHWDHLGIRIDQCMFGPDIDGFDHWERMTVYHELFSQAQHNETHRELFNEHYEGMVVGLADVLQAGIDDGTFAEVDAMEFSQLLTDVIHSARARRISLGQNDAPEQARTAIDRFVLPRLVPNVSVEIPTTE
ncbi:TetR/AcrR family transcriptional regulator [Halalkalicoccus jeotgali]|uniref:AcrR family transcriptional regulator n=1 Tax=Halalkalicoccus jeotgali (strain DSM 18796 / CECT 7217 / JCM 14584 / KCTC 4019 / B3) TaxID=795797 RepID=D8J9H6_HALJB|nr:TetR/AcrR family transcriptional regulator [Halalkalicoccus jeotgali]ADJ14388.1 AcrR family transcriptional regulator [Halalkalicoccus jeotgali B3]ELY40649.1 AcrR family transcriptional regulator [Halalkalicoccus jeotgali B3]